MHRRVCLNGSCWVQVAVVCMVVALLLALATNVYSWWNSGSVVLRAFRAREAWRAAAGRRRPAACWGAAPIMHCNARKRHCAYHAR